MMMKSWKKKRIQKKNNRTKSIFIPDYNSGHYYWSDIHGRASVLHETTPGCYEGVASSYETREREKWVWVHLLCDLLPPRDDIAGTTDRPRGSNITMTGTRRLNRQRPERGDWKRRTGKWRTKCQRWKVHDWKMYDLKTKDRTSLSENAGPESKGPDRTGLESRTGPTVTWQYATQ